jgi:putative endonuclease
VPGEPRARGAAHLHQGAYGERLAARWYEAEGFRIVERNWRVAIGEVDLIVHQGGLLVFCEVKARANDRFGSPLEAITPTKQRRLRRLAAAYLSSDWQFGPVDVRFDAVSVCGGRIDVIPGAW